MPRPTSETPTFRSPIARNACCPAASSKELVDNDRSIGGITPRCARKALAFYKLFVRGACVTTDARSAEMTKLVENAYRDVNIAFANELSIISDRMGLDVWEVIRLANRHPRVNILSARPRRRRPLHRGRSVVHRPRRARGNPLIRTARGVNDGKIHHVIAKADALVAAHPNAKVACLGLAFKANIDDFRESPARLVASHARPPYGERIHIVEPYASELPIEFTDTGAT
jgi:UDP-N-acetyl-D-mannosaminuronic acid dehydrogenase